MSLLRYGNSFAFALLVLDRIFPNLGGCGEGCLSGAGRRVLLGAEVLTTLLFAGVTGILTTGALGTGALVTGALVTGAFLEEVPEEP